MFSNYTYFVILFASILSVKASRILVVVPTASISHQVEFRPLSQELARRGHEVVVITTDPAFPKGQAPINLTEIDVHDVTYAAKNKGFDDVVTGKSDDIFKQIKMFFRLFHVMFEAVLNHDKVQSILKYDIHHFDVLILEACNRPTLIFSHIFNAPVIWFSSLPSFGMINRLSGAEMHPLLFPSCINQRINNLTVFEKAKELYKYYSFEKVISDLEEEGDIMLRRNFANDIPGIGELKKNVEMVFLTEYHFWDNNRPVPPSVLYLGGIHPINSTKDLPSDLETYLDSSIHGVIYVSFGTNVNCSMIPPQAVETFLSVFSKLPYDVLMKWDNDFKLPKAPNNVKVSEWLPQSDLLRHPKIKLFITQGGLQSTNEAIFAGVPLIAIPMLGDQWFNAEQYMRLKIGLKLEMESINEDIMLNAINTVIEDESFRQNVQYIRNWSRDQPQTPLERAVWWTEHVIRHKGARHLRAPSALISYWDYFEIDLLLAIAVCLLFMIAILAILLFYLTSFFWSFVINTKIKHE